MLLPPVGHAELPAHEQRKPKVCCLLTTETSGSCCCSLRLSRVSITTATSAPTFVIPGITYELSSVHGLLRARAHAKQRNSMHNQLANVQAKDANPSTACKSTYPPLTIRNRTNTYWCSSSSNPNAHRTEPSHAHNVIRDELTVDRRRMPFAAHCAAMVTRGGVAGGRRSDAGGERSDRSHARRSRGRETKRWRRRANIDLFFSGGRTIDSPIIDRFS